jgi:UDP-N-acetylmuramoyl-tripeptide--D-alanyl-D-alanine ligase
VIETSIEAPGQMAFAARFIRPDIAVVTSIGSEHRRAFGSLEAIRNEKADIVRSLPLNGLAVLNGDDPNVLWMKGVTKARVLKFGFASSNDIYATDVSMQWPRGMEFVLHLDQDVRKVRLRLIGKHMVYAGLAAVAVAYAEGIGLDQITTALEELEPTPGRMEPVRLANGAILLRDDFKSPVETIETALATLSEIPAKRRIVVLGQISEAPGNHKETQRRIGHLIAQAAASYAIFIGVNCRPYISGASRAGMDRNAIRDAGTNPSVAIETLAPMLRDGDVVLIKGRSSEKLDRITLALMGRRVGCTIGFCDAELRCSECKMLEGGWAGYRHLGAAKNNVPAPVRNPSTQSTVERT